MKSNLQTSNNVGSSNHPVIINVKALLLSADAPRDNEKENPTTQAFFFFSLYRPMPSKVFFPELVGPLKKLQYSTFYSAYCIVYRTVNINRLFIGKKRFTFGCIMLGKLKRLNSGAKLFVHF